jgi:pimeloyl-ACP methyl ester carboxylesterase
MADPVSSNLPDRLEELRGFLRPSEYWDAWLEKTKESPPDFDALASIPDLPDPLDFLGRKISTPEEWQDQRAVILQTYREFVIGSYPEPPEKIDAKILFEQKHSDGAVVRQVELRFGPGKKAKLGLELALPPGKGPFPVFMTQRNQPGWAKVVQGKGYGDHTGWARIALARGYAAVAYNGSDASDDTQAYKEIWPECDWSMLCRRAWGAGRALDWLHTLPSIDKSKTCITGHSRNGKLSMICGAIDERFNVVIASSAGIGGISPFRLANESHFSEGIELLTFNFPEWFHPRLRFFAGREHKLPVDVNLLLSLIAPRAVLVATSLNDPCEHAKANELSVESARPVWKLFKAEDKLGIIWRWGDHETRAEEIERYLDWCDLQFRRSSKSSTAELSLWFGSQHQSVFPYNFAQWKILNGESIDASELPTPIPLSKRTPKDRTQWLSKHNSRMDRMLNLLGETPATASRIISDYGREFEYQNILLYRPAIKDREIAKDRFNFGEYIPATVYVGAKNRKNAMESGEKIPGAIWLHPESLPSGYSGAYIRGDHMPLPLVKEGFAVLAYDQIGNGSRLEEGTRFYRRYPKWSILGKMIHDIHRAIDALLQIPYIDSKRLFLVGFGSGAMAAIFAAAIDSRVSGVASVSGFCPFRSDTPDQPTGGLARYSLWRGSGLIPKLGFFANHPEKVLIDFDEIIASLAPRPFLCVTPTLDREANHSEVVTTLETASKIYSLYDSPDQLWHYAPVDHRRFTPEIQAPLYQALRTVANLT